MKKVLAVIAVVAVVCVAGAAFAQPRGRDDARRMPPQLQKEFSGEMGHLDQRRPEQKFDRTEGFCGMCRGFGRMNGRGHGRMMFAPDMPEEIRAKAVEAAKLRIDLEAEMSAKTINKAKAMEIFAKVQKAENEIDTWRFGKRLERMEAFRTQRELNRKIPPACIMPPAPKDEAPAPESEAPAPQE